MKKRRLLAVGLAAALGAGVLAACSVSTAGPNTIIIYNGQHEQTTDALITAFERSTGIRVEVHSGDEDALVDQIEEEGSASPADVIYTENSPALMALQGKSLLAHLPSAVLDQVPSRYNSPQGNWVGVSARVSVLVYNTSLLKPSELPTSVLDLANPEWKGKLAIAPTETDFQPIVTSIALSRGTAAALAWLKAIKANGAAHNDPDNETVTADVNSGSAAIGIINHYYWYRLRAEVGAGAMHSAIAYFAPRDPGYVIDVSGAAVLSSSHHRADAEAFLSFLVSAQGQETLTASDSFEYPLRPGVSAPPGLRPFDQLEPAPVTVADLGDGSLALALLQKVELL